MVEINDREIVIELHNLGKDKTALRYFTREWNAVDTDESITPTVPNSNFRWLQASRGAKNTPGFPVRSKTAMELVEYTLAEH